MFDTLQKLARAMGFHGICPEFLTDFVDYPASVSTKAVELGFTADDGAKAKQEFRIFMRQMQAMFAPVEK